MPNFCPHCGTAVSAVNSELCVNCGKPLNAIPDSPKNELFNDSKDKLFNLAKNVKDFSVKASEDLRSDETKAKIKDLANQAQSFASEKTKDLKEELEKINEARKATANEAKDFESTSKLENSKAVASSFWSKLSSKQKLIFIGLPVFLFVCLMALFEESDSSSLKKVSPKWAMIGKDDTYSFYFDPDTIRKDGNMRQVWEITDLNTRDKDGEMSVQMRVEYDCKQERFRFIAFSKHSENMAAGKTLKSITKEGPWGAIPPNSASQLMLIHVCSK